MTAQPGYRLPGLYSAFLNEFRQARLRFASCAGS